MNWRRAFLGQIVVPVLGGLALAYGGYSLAAVPSLEQIEALRVHSELVESELGAVRLRPTVDVDRFSEQLPFDLDVGAVLKTVQGFAAECDIQAIRFDLEEGAAQEGARSDDEAPETVPMVGELGESGPGVEAELPQSAEIVQCRFEIESSYEALVRFAGKIESMTPAATIVGLDIKAGPRLVDSKMVVMFHYLPWEEK